MQTTKHLTRHCPLGNLVVALIFCMLYARLFRGLFMPPYRLGRAANRRGQYSCRPSGPATARCSNWCRWQDRCAPTAGVVRPSCVETAIAAVRPLQQVACRSRSHIRTGKLFGCSLRTELGLVRCWPIDCRQLVSVRITQLSTHTRRAMND